MILQARYYGFRMVSRALFNLGRQCSKRLEQRDENSMRFSIKDVAYPGSRTIVSLLVLMTSATINIPTAYGCLESNSGIQSPVLEVSFPDRPFSDRPTRKMLISADRSNALIHISSKLRIGRATIRLIQGSWPKSTTIRVYLKGLEGFTLINGTTVIEKHQLKVQAYDKNKNPYDQKYLMDEAGYYEIRLSESLITPGTTKIKIQWVDFYRN